jgi:DNA ligase-1
MSDETGPEPLADIEDGDFVEMKGSSATPYVLRNAGGVYSCTCPAWRNQSLGLEKRTCKHLKKLRGEAAEAWRTGGAKPAPKGEGAETEGPPVLLAQKWTPDVDPTGWWMSEKLDGVRAYWDGSKLISRLGNAFSAPDWFVAGLPSEALHGELWIGRKAFQRTVGVVRRQDKTKAWEDVRYVLFDAPNVPGPFEERYAAIEGLVRGAPYASRLEQQRCASERHLTEEMDRVSALGAEGLMLRKPGSAYEVGRSSILLKVKRFLDADARVVGHLAGAGRHKGRLGSVMVELQDGKRFQVGTGFSDAERESPPPIGTVIVFRYQELSDGGIPRFPTYAGVRAEGDFVPEPSIATPRAAEPAGTRRFEMVDGGSAKFWEVTVTGSAFAVRYGRIGTNGQTQVKSFTSPAEASSAAEKLVSEKVGKGYREVRAVDS